MRTGLFVPLALFAAIVAGRPAPAAQLRMPADTLAHYDAYSSPEIAEPWATQRPGLVLNERPIGEIIATRLGLVKGSAELFRYHLENAPSNTTVLDGAVNGGGIKLKLTW